MTNCFIISLIYPLGKLLEILKFNADVKPVQHILSLRRQLVINSPPLTGSPACGSLWRFRKDELDAMLALPSLATVLAATHTGSAACECVPRRSGFVQVGIATGFFRPAVEPRSVTAPGDCCVLNSELPFSDPRLLELHYIRKAGPARSMCADSSADPDWRFELANV